MRHVNYSYVERKDMVEAKAENIRAFWRRLGYEVKVNVELFYFGADKSHPVYEIKSDLINGLPREYFVGRRVRTSAITQALSGRLGFRHPKLVDGCVAFVPSNKGNGHDSTDNSIPESSVA